MGDSGGIVAFQEEGVTKDHGYGSSIHSNTECWRGGNPSHNDRQEFHIERDQSWKSLMSGSIFGDRALAEHRLDAR